MYEQSLYKVIEPIKINTLKRLNKSKKWEYGYNKEHDVIVISKTGMIGEIYEIQNLKIALPKKPKDVHKFESNRWEVTEYQKELNRIRAVINRKLPAQVRENMGRPALENQTGRFSNSVQLLRLREAGKTIMGEYSYLLTPYETFENTGEQDWPNAYNPKDLITKSIRDLAPTVTDKKFTFRLFRV